MTRPVRRNQTARGRKRAHAVYARAAGSSPASARSRESNWAPRAILFDLDGTLVDSFRAICSSVNHVRRHFGLRPLSESTVNRAVGSGLSRLLQRTVPVGILSENERLYLAHHPKVLEPLTRLLPGVRRTLSALHRRGLRLAVCSNKPLPMTRLLLKAVGLDGLFDATLGPESVRHPKPHPQMLLAALDRLAVRADEALYVGDMTIDVAFARAAGVRVWVIATGADSPIALRRAAPDRLMRRFNELLRLTAR